MKNDSPADHPDAENTAVGDEPTDEAATDSPDTEIAADGDETVSEDGAASEDEAASKQVDSAKADSTTAEGEKAAPTKAGGKAPKAKKASSNTLADKKPERAADRQESSTGSGWGFLAAGAIAVLVVAVAIAAIFGVGAVRAYWPGNAAETARNDAVAAAEQAMLNVTSIDPQELAAWDARLEGSFTGEAREQIGQEFGPLREAAEQVQGVKLTSRLVRSAPSEVDAEGGTASVLIYLATTRQQNNEAVNTVMMTFLVQMIDDDGTWKADKVDSLEGFAFDDVDGAPDGNPLTPQGPNQQAPSEQDPADQNGAGQEGGN